MYSHRMIFRLTVWTVTSLTDDPILLTDVNGGIHPLPGSSIVTMIGAGWGLYLGSICLNYLYYKVHPSATDISGGALVSRFVCQEEKGCCREAWRCYLMCCCCWCCCCPDLVRMSREA